SQGNPMAHTVRPGPRRKSRHSGGPRPTAGASIRARCALLKFDELLLGQWMGHLAVTSVVLGVAPLALSSCTSPPCVVRVWQFGDVLQCPLLAGVLVEAAISPCSRRCSSYKFARSLLPTI